ncbi:MAG: hypothetical protein K2V38_27260 [Gemmataceae bacterium]|nr:hypothetical protein [Gemmataceae bacterium]
MPEEAPRRYKVALSGTQADYLKSEAAWARAKGVLKEYVAALKEIEFRLTIEPADWGESRERMAEARVQMRCGTSRMVTVLYGVAEDRDVVFVKEFRVNRDYQPPSPA